MQDLRYRHALKQGGGEFIRCDVLTASSPTTFSGQGALKIIHQNGTGCSVWHELGTYLVGDTLTTTVWLNSPVGTSGQVFLGNVNVPNAYDNATSIEVPGTGIWQAVTLSKTITGTPGSSRDMQVFLYGNVVNGQTTNDGTYSCWDEITVANSAGFVFHDGFEGGLSTSWVKSGQPNVNLQNLVARDVIYLGNLAIAEVDGNGIHELHCDPQGTPRMSTGGLSGAVDGTQAFGPYGEAMPLYTSGYIPLTGYTGHVQTDDTGLIYMKGRYYSPAWHRFINSNRGADPNQLNQFAYVNGSPLMAIDPSGMNIWTDILDFINHQTMLGWDILGVNIPGAPGGINQAASSYGQRQGAAADQEQGATVPVTADYVPPMMQDPYAYTMMHLAQTGSGQIWVDPSLSQANPYLTQGKQLGKDVAGLNPWINGVMLAKSVKDRSLGDFLSNLVGASPLGNMWSGVNILGDVFGFGGIFVSNSVVVPMVTNDNRGPQPFNVDGGYNPAFDEGAPF